MLKPFLNTICHLGRATTVFFEVKETINLQQGISTGKHVREIGEE